MWMEWNERKKISSSPFLQFSTFFVYWIIQYADKQCAFYAEEKQTHVTLFDENKNNAKKLATSISAKWGPVHFF